MKIMPLALQMAWRYMRAPKSHGAVSVISIISVVGVAVATAAIVIVLSVFNGFRSHLNNRLDSLTSDISVAPVLGKTIEDSDSLLRVIEGIKGVDIAMPAVTDNALVIANSKEMPITLKGVELHRFSRITKLDSLLLDGYPSEFYDKESAAISVGVAQRLGIASADGDILIFAPRRVGRINTANPASSFLSDSLQIRSVFRTMQNEFDENTVICDISAARDLFQYDSEATSIEIKAREGYNIEKLAAEISEIVGDGYVVKDRYHQQEVNYRMVAIEKWLTFVLLSFILVIASFNIISTICMLIVEKQQNLITLHELGFNKRKIGSIFWWESMLITLSGALSGIILGVILCLIQEKFSIIKLAGDPDSLVIQAYPVEVEWLDLGVTALPILLIGLVTALISRRFAMARTAAN